MLTGDTVKLLTAQTRVWKAIADDEDAAASLERHLTAALIAERLVVLTGLGTSRCIKDVAGTPVAPTMQDLWDQAKKRSDKTFDKVLDRVGWSAEWPDDIELLLSRCQMAVALKPDEEIAEFIEGTERGIAEACSFVSSEIDLTIHETFLRRVARRSTRLPRTQIFTTNYDLAFEASAARTGFALIDGFSHAHPQRFDGVYFDRDFAVRDRERSAGAVEWVPNVAQLHKLHGSVDWYATDGGEVGRDPAQARPLIVYPRSTKFEISYQQPFLELMARYQAALRRPETGLIVIGSGFSDDHITEPVMAAVRSNVRLTGIIISPSLETKDNPHIRKIAGMIESGDHRFALLAATFEEAVLRFPDLVAPTETERHADRVAAASDG